MYLPIDGSRLVKGDRVFLLHVKEVSIGCNVKDAMEMVEPVNGDAVGDAVFDAMTASKVLSSVIGGKDSDGNVDYVIGFDAEGLTVLLGTGSNAVSHNVCDPMVTVD